MVLGKALRLSEGTGSETSYGALASRIGALCKDGRLESAGNISRWRHSEVRRPAKIDDDDPEPNA